MRRGASMVFQRRGLINGLFPLREQAHFFPFVTTGSFTFPTSLTDPQKRCCLHPRQLARPREVPPSRCPGFPQGSLETSFPRASPASPGSFLPGFLGSFPSRPPSFLLHTGLEDHTWSPFNSLLQADGEVSSLLSRLPGHTVGDQKSGILVTDLHGPRGGFFCFQNHGHRWTDFTRKSQTVIPHGPLGVQEWPLSVGCFRLLIRLP